MESNYWRIVRITSIAGVDRSDVPSRYLIEFIIWRFLIISVPCWIGNDKQEPVFFSRPVKIDALIQWNKIWTQSLFASPFYIPIACQTEKIQDLLGILYLSLSGLINDHTRLMTVKGDLFAVVLRALFPTCSLSHLHLCRSALRPLFVQVVLLLF